MRYPRHGSTAGTDARLDLDADAPGHRPDVLEPGAVQPQLVQELVGTRGRDGQGGKLLDHRMNPLELLPVLCADLLDQRLEAVQLADHLPVAGLDPPEGRGGLAQHLSHEGHIGALLLLRHRKAPQGRVHHRQPVLQRAVHLALQAVQLGSDGRDDGGQLAAQVGDTLGVALAHLVQQRHQDRLGRRAAATAHQRRHLAADGHQLVGQGLHRGANIPVGLAGYLQALLQARDGGVGLDARVQQRVQGPADVPDLLRVRGRPQPLRQVLHPLLQLLERAVLRLGQVLHPLLDRLGLRRRRSVQGTVELLVLQGACLHQVDDLERLDLDGHALVDDIEPLVELGRLWQERKRCR